MNYDQSRIRAASKKRQRRLERWLDNHNEGEPLLIDGREVDYGSLQDYRDNTRDFARKFPHRELEESRR